MMTEKLQKVLNEQVTAEMWSANLYLSMSFHLEREGYTGFASWLKKQSQEEMEHAYAIAGYIIKRGGIAKVDKIDVVPTGWGTPLEVFEHVYEHECHVSKMIDGLVAIASSEKDNATQDFLWGFVREPELPPRADGHLNVGAAVGKDGTLDVIRDLGMREPYIGQVPLTSGEIAEDITTYFAISEQVPTVCALGVLVDKDLSVRCAGGFVVQLLPGATEEEIEHLEKNIKAMPSVTTMLEEGKSVRDMLELALAGFAPDILDSYHVTYKCDCGLERVEKMIRSLGKKEVERMRDEDPVAEVNCQFCNKNYKVDLNELLKNWPSTAENESGENA